MGWLFRRGPWFLLPLIPSLDGRGRAAWGRARSVGHCWLYGWTLLKRKSLFHPDLKLGSANGTPTWVPCECLRCKRPVEGKTAETSVLRPPETIVAVLPPGTVEL